MSDDTIRTTQEVIHVNGLKRNLLSLGQLDDFGCKTHVENGIIKIDRGAFVVMKENKIASNMYMLKAETLYEADACVTTTEREKSQQ